LARAPWFALRDPLLPRCYVVSYDHHDPAREVSREQIDCADLDDLSEDGLLGYALLEQVLRSLTPRATGLRNGERPKERR
jgi:hypothetical protein